MRPSPIASLPAGDFGLAAARCVVEPGRFLAELRGRLAGRDMDRVRVAISHGLPFLLVDPGHLELVLESLLAAALERSHQEIVVAAEPHSPSSLRISIVCPAPEALPARCLAVSAVLMHANGGGVELDDASGGGTIVRLIVPTCSA